MIEVTAEGKVLKKTGDNRLGRCPEAARDDLLAGPKRDFQIFDCHSKAWIFLNKSGLEPMNRLMMLEQLRKISKFGLILGLGNFSLTAQVAPTNRPASQSTPVAPANLPPPPPNVPRPVPAPPPIAVPFGSGAIMDPNNLPLRVMGAGVFELANVTMDKRQRSVSFPAVVNMDQGPMEYFLVTTFGKVHESILRTETMPYHLHIAMLLLDAEGASKHTLPEGSPRAGADGQANQRGKPSTISKPEDEILSGDKLAIEVSWSIDGKETTRRAEDLVRNAETKAAMGKGNWVYNGSEVIVGTFQSQVTGSLVSLITDRQALINSIAPGHENDDIWAVNTNSLPPVNTPVRVTLRLEDGRPKN